jgi:cytochrome c
MNKIVVSIIFVIIVVVGINKISNKIFHVQKPEKSAYQIANASSSEESEISKSTNSTDTVSGDILVLMTSVSAAEGKKIFKKCTACHSIAKSGGNKIGPALWGVLGRKAGSISGYKYSKAMVLYGKLWSFEEMNGFLTKPKEWVKGTKMSFAGLKNSKERASLILYMNENSSSPLPLN